MANAKNANPIKGSIEPVPNLPTHVVIYKISWSPYWWTRCYTPQKRYVIRSTKTTGKREAQAFARQLYIDSLTNNITAAKTNPKTMAAVAESLLREEQANAKPSLYKKDKNMLTNAVMPHFGTKLLTDVTHADLTEYLGKLNQKGLSPATKKHHMGLIGKVFSHGIKLGVIQNKPAFPKLGQKLATAEKRDYLTLSEYKTLSNTIIRMWRNGVKYRGTPITLEHKLMVNFMINSFLRPGDLAVLKHKHIQRASDEKSRWLILNHPATKTTADPVHAMPRTTRYYDELLKFRNGKHSSPDDYVFFPEYENREHGIRKLGKLFAEIVKESKLRELTGKRIDLYSLRHTSLMFRILYSDVDPLTLSKHARTSVAVLEKFYLSHLTTDQARRRLHGFAKKANRQSSDRATRTA